MVVEGRIITIISNLFYVELDNNKIIECTSRGIFKNKDIKPVVGDIVKIDNENNSILEVLNRTSYIKRPKIANVTKLILVVSAKKPSPDLLMLDKQLSFAEYMNIKPVIVINKIDLPKEIAEEIKEQYKFTNYE